MDIYSKLARQTIKQYLENNNLPDTQKQPAELINKRAGCFVSLHKNHELRGCIGTIIPTCKNLAGEIINNAIAACRDPRFLPVEKKEVQDLEIQVDVLSEPEPIASPQSLDPKKYGVIVSSKDGRTGVLLPDLEGVDNADDQISIACQKADINPDEPMQLYRFKVTRHKEN